MEDISMFARIIFLVYKLGLCKYSGYHHAHQTFVHMRERIRYIEKLNGGP